MSPPTGTILFASLPEAGLINPLLVLAAELSRRGVRDLWFATDEPRRDEVEATSAAFASLGEVIPELSAVSWDDKVYREVTRGSRFRAHRAVLRQSYRPDLAMAKYRQLEAVVDKVNPAVMVIDSETRFAITLATARRIPYVLSVPFVPSHVLAPYTPLARSYVPRGFPAPHSGLPYDMSFTQRMSNRLFKLRCLAMLFDPGLARAFRADIALYAELGLPRQSQMTRVDLAELVLCQSVPELDYSIEVPEKVRLVGAMIPPLPQAPDPELAGWLDAHSSVIYVGLGTITRLTRPEVASLVEVARRLEGAHHVLWKLPAGQHHLLPPSLPGNLRIESWVPSQVDVLAHPNVRAFVSHGGSNGFHEGLYFGKPQVVRPLWVDCYDQAVRGQGLGVSLTLDHPQTIDPDDVTAKLTRVLDDPSFRHRAERLAARQRAAGGRAAAADLVLGLPTLNHYRSFPSQ
ncbi:MAG: glycosyltransferase [Streptosporangiaceae bacterium]